MSLTFETHLSTVETLARLRADQQVAKGRAEQAARTLASSKAELAAAEAAVADLGRAVGELQRLLDEHGVNPFGGA